MRRQPHITGPGPALAAQRNYLQALHAAVADKGVYVGRLYIGAAIENSAFHAWWTPPGRPAPARDWGPTVSPDHLADLLWTMHSTKDPAEATYPEAILNR